VDGKICYINTDLDLVSAADLTLLAAALKEKGVPPLHVTRGDDGLWYSILETDTDFVEPEPNIAVMLNAVESLKGPLRSAWSRCKLREFNIGYDCGNEPWAFNQGLSSGLLSRIAASGATLRITIYPDKPARKRSLKRKGNDVAKPKPNRNAKREKPVSGH
jgi:hypothetical protein